jgi:hypothetical protein
MTMLWKSAGMIVAPLAWAATTQAGQILSYLDCQGRVSWSLIAIIAAATLSVGAVGISYLQMSHDNATSFFVSSLGAGIGLAFTFAIFLQGAAVLLLSPCQL